MILSWSGFPEVESLAACTESPPTGARLEEADAPILCVIRESSLCPLPVNQQPPLLLSPSAPAALSPLRCSAHGIKARNTFIAYPDTSLKFIQTYQQCNLPQIVKMQKANIIAHAVYAQCV